MASYGLDFGTTNSSLSTLVDGGCVLLPIDEAAENRVMEFDPFTSVAAGLALE